MSKPHNGQPINSFFVAHLVSANVEVEYVEDPQLAAWNPSCACAGVESIGVCNGMIGNDLPSPQDVVQLYRSKGISNMRIYAPHSDVMEALRGSGIGLILGVETATSSASPLPRRRRRPGSTPTSRPSTRA
ncbi:hypothetical protein PR202_gb03787 [Eleusine coracana subsp. coracana]|uniref:Glucan endo-1,3-beta-D-glucosidase n=1 Tax=Eleusine coracana subsp. coracana TaxID=191504 RepID=A0AAV5E2U0_ELECO|nr:hypothetical protein PR202_gb03787 [Eleusine coracana subsp. coracana]